MKKVKTLFSIAIFAILVISSNLFAQGIYVDIETGYGVKTSSQTLDYFGFYSVTEFPDSSTVEQVYISLGEGLHFGGAVGYMFNESIGAELGLSYLLGGGTTARSESYDGDTTTYTLSSNMLRIIPTFVISSGFGRFNPYAKFGMVLGIGSVGLEMLSIEEAEVSRMTTKFDGGLAVGLKAATGASFTLRDNMSLFGEMGMINMSYAPTRGEVTEATLNGADMLPGMTTNEREIEFVDNYTAVGVPTPESQPDRRLKQKMPFSSFGINFGLRINF